MHMGVRQQLMLQNRCNLKLSYVSLFLIRKLIAKEVKLAEQRSKVACLVEQANDLKEQIHRAAKEKNFLVAQFEKIRYFKEVAVSQTE